MRDAKRTIERLSAHKSGHRVPVRVVRCTSTPGSIVGIAKARERVVQLGADVLVHAHSLPDSRDAISGLLDANPRCRNLNAAVEAFQQTAFIRVIALASTGWTSSGGPRRSRRIV